MKFDSFKEQVASNLRALLKNSSLSFHGKRFDVYRHEQQGINQKKVIREVAIHPGAVVILPLIDDETVVMIRNERFAVGETLWELPAGTLEPEEPPEKTASRELIEETGYQAKSIEPLISFYTTPGFCNEAMYAFVARDLQFVGQDLDDTEKITTEAIKWPLLLEMIKNGQIRDGKTIATLLYFYSFELNGYGRD